MNRRYTAKEYEAAVNLLRETLPDVSISTDVIVGFQEKQKRNLMKHMNI